MIGTLPAVVVALVLGQGVPAEELVAVPRVPLDGVPPSGRQQLESLAAEVDEIGMDDRLGAAQAYGELGKLYFAYGFFDSAEAAWRNAATLQPASFHWHYFLGALLRQQGRLDEAAGQFEAALAIRPDRVEALVRLGRIRTEQGRWDEAAARFERALTIAPEHSAALYGLGRIAVAEGRFADALGPLEAALAGQPEGTSVHHQLGLAYRGLGRLDEARDHLGRSQGVLIVFPDPLMEEVVGLVEGAHVRARAGIQAQRAGRFELAVRLLNEAIALDPGNAWVRYNLGVTYQEAGDDEAAVAEFARAVELDPDYRNAHFNLAQQLASAGDYAGAARHFQRASEIDPEDRQARLELAVARSRMGQEVRAMDILRSLTREAPDFVEARLALATYLAQLGLEQEALREAEAVLQGDATSSDLAAAHLLLGRLGEARDPVGALGHFRSAVELDPGSTEAHFALAMAAGRSGRFEEAAEQFDALILLRPEDPQLRLGQSMALLLGADYVRARQSLEASLSRFPEQIDLMHNLARLLATCPDDSVRDGQEALRLAQRSLQLRQSIDHAETMAMALAELGRFDEAGRVQSEVVARREVQGESSSLSRSRSYLTSYQQQRAVRAPWSEGS